MVEYRNDPFSRRAEQRAQVPDNISALKRLGLVVRGRYDDVTSVRISDEATGDRFREVPVTSVVFRSKRHQVTAFVPPSEEMARMIIAYS